MKGVILGKSKIDIVISYTPSTNNTSVCEVEVSRLKWSYSYVNIVKSISVWLSAYENKDSWIREKLKYGNRLKKKCKEPKHKIIRIRFEYDNNTQKYFIRW